MRPISSPPSPPALLTPVPPRRDDFATPDEALFSAAVNRLLGDVMVLSAGARRLHGLAEEAAVTGVDVSISAVLRALSTAAVELEMVARTREPGPRSGGLRAAGGAPR